MRFAGIASATAPFSAVRQPAARFDTAVGQGVEALAVLSTQSSISTGGYRFRVAGADGEVVKVPWTTDPAYRLPLSDSGLYWAPVVSGGVGYGDFKTLFPNGELVGNQSEFRTAAVAAAFGPRIYLNSQFSVLPSLGGIYGYSQNEFHALNAAGEQFASTARGTLVDWRAQTLTLAPSIELRYVLERGPWTLKLTSNYSYFQTWPVERSTQALNFRSDSSALVNGIDLGFQTPLRVLDFPLHVGGSFSRTDLFSGLGHSLDVDHFYRVGVRFVLNSRGAVPWLDRLGIGAAYVWGHGFGGYSVGIEL